MLEDKFSLALTTYNRANIIIPYIKRYETYENLNEIIVIDDYSHGSDYDCLKKESWSNKVKIFQNESNVGCYLNKIYALSQTTSNRVLLFDSDNFFEEQYLDILKNILIQDNLNDDMIYCPESALPKFIYNHLTDIIIDKNNWNNLHNKEECFVNTGQQFFSRKAINCLINNIIEDKTNPFATDAKYINYILIKNGFMLKCVKNLKYNHNISSDSIWQNTSKSSGNFNQSFNWIIN